MSLNVMKLALEALEYVYEGANNQGPHTGISWRDVSNKAEPIITSLRQAIDAQMLASKPPGLCMCGEPWRLESVHRKKSPCFDYIEREWVGLTDEDELDWDGGDLRSLVKAIEAKLRSKNI